MNAPAPISMNQFYADIIAKMKEVDASDKMYPTTRTGFFKLVNADGKDLGYAFYCPKCRTSACGLSEDAVIRHCGKATRFPRGLFGWLVKFGLRSYTLERTWF